MTLLALKNTLHYVFFGRLRKKNLNEKQKNEVHTHRLRDQNICFVR
jgi:hypothetical protein